MNPPVFVIGVPRSGTTWLQHMLKAHPALAGPAAETAVFETLHELHANGRVATAAGPVAVTEALRGFVTTLFEGWLSANAPDADRIVEKTPLHAEHLDTIARVFPSATVIGITRDGRDVVRSLLEMDAAPDDASRAARRWADITGKVARGLPQFERYANVRYEALVADPVGGVVALLELMDLTVDEAVRAEIERRAAERVSQYNTTGDVGSGKWETMRAADRRAVYRYAGDRLAELGYVTAEQLATERGRLAYRVENLLTRVRRP